MLLRFHRHNIYSFISKNLLDRSIAQLIFYVICTDNLHTCTLGNHHRSYKYRAKKLSGGVLRCITLIPKHYFLRSKSSKRYSVPFLRNLSSGCAMSSKESR